MAVLRRHAVRIAVYGSAALVVAGVVAFRGPLARAVRRLPAVFQDRVRMTMKGLAPRVEAPLRRRVEAVGVRWPPARTTWVAVKDARRLEVHVADAGGPFRLLKHYPVLAASGRPGPKRREGDRQVPEGVYRLTTLNPDSAYHLSVRVDYPNADDRARLAGSTEPLGGDIYVHGKSVSIGCLAVGDAAIEELFYLAATVPAGSRQIIIAPTDYRLGGGGPPQTPPRLRATLKTALRELSPAPR